MDLYFHTLELLGEHDARDVLDEVDVPLLVISGDRDLFTPRRAAEDMVRGGAWRRAARGARAARTTSPSSTRSWSTCGWRSSSASAAMWALEPRGGLRMRRTGLVLLLVAMASLAGCGGEPEGPSPTLLDDITTLRQVVIADSGGQPDRFRGASGGRPSGLGVPAAPERRHPRGAPADRGRARRPRWDPRRAEAGRSGWRPPIVCAWTASSSGGPSSPRRDATRSSSSRPPARSAAPRSPWSDDRPGDGDGLAHAPAARRRGRLPHRPRTRPERRSGIGAARTFPLPSLTTLILVVDNYDSFTYNLVQYLAEAGRTCGCSATTPSTSKGSRALDPEGILLSPGPGTPDDAGISLEVVRRLAGPDPDPRRLPRPSDHRAGLRRARGTGRTADARAHLADAPPTARASSRALPSPLTATRYHSLIVERESLPDALVITAWTEEGGDHGAPAPSSSTWKGFSSTRSRS